jgi:hypothetical protein
VTTPDAPHGWDRYPNLQLAPRAPQRRDHRERLMIKRSYGLPYGYTVTLSWKAGLCHEWKPCVPLFKEERRKFIYAYAAAVRSFMTEVDALLTRCPDITSPAGPTKH